MDLLHSWGVELAVHLQTTYSRYEGLFRLASTVADLHTTFFCFFPIWFHLRRHAGLGLVWVAVRPRRLAQLGPEMVTRSNINGEVHRNT